MQLKQPPCTHNLKLLQFEAQEIILLSGSCLRRNGKGIRTGSGGIEGGGDGEEEKEEEEKRNGCKNDDGGLPK